MDKRSNIDLDKVNEGYFCNLRPEMLNMLPDSTNNILEVGCGAGRFSMQIKVTGERWGVEPDAEAATEASACLTKVLHGTYMDVKDELPAGYFDLVICNDVIEHMEDHDAFLNDIKNAMTKDGVLVASVPNVRFYKNLRDILFRKDWKYVDSGVLDRTHLRFFTFKSMQRSLAECGFSIQDMQGMNSAITGSLSPKGIFRQFFLMSIILLSVFSWWDIQYMQIAFRCNKN